MKHFTLYLVAATLFLASCTKPKTTGHIYCAIKGNPYLASDRPSDFSINLMQNNLAIYGTSSKKDSVTVDLGEWNPGIYTIQGLAVYKSNAWAGATLQYECDTSFEIQANTTETITLDAWY